MQGEHLKLLGLLLTSTLVFTGFAAIQVPALATPNSEATESPLVLPQELKGESSDGSVQSEDAQAWTYEPVGLIVELSGEKGKGIVGSKKALRNFVAEEIAEDRSLERSLSDLSLENTLEPGTHVFRTPDEVPLDDLESLAGELESKTGVESVDIEYRIFLPGATSSNSGSTSPNVGATSSVGEPAIALPPSSRRASVRPAAIQNRPTWGLDRIDQISLPLDSKYDYDSAGSGVRIYVIDSGINWTHNDFTNRVPYAYTFYRDWNNNPTAWDCNGHGTHVASTAAGTTYGVAKAATIVPIRVFDCGGSTTTSMIWSAIDIVSDDLASSPSDAVVNMSLGGPFSSTTNSKINNLVNSGVPVVVASGNDSSNACYSSPASATEAITVNASTRFDTDAWFSNYGSCTDIYAPGEDVTAAWWTSNSSTSTISGTSMASPHVAGAVARLISAGYPTDSDFETILASKNQAMNTGLSGDPTALLYLGKEPFSTVGSVEISGLPVLGQQLTATLGGTWVPTPTSVSYQWRANGLAIRNATNSSYTLTSTDVGKAISVAVSTSAAGYLAASSVSSATSNVLAAMSFTTTAAPTISGLTESGAAIVGRTLTASVSGWEPTATTLRHQWLSNGSAISGATASSYVLKATDVGKAISVRVTGSRTSYTAITLTSTATGAVLSGLPFDTTSAPTISGLTDSGAAIVGRTLTASVSDWEPTATTVTYQWLSNGSAISGATTSSYVLKAADVGKAISVRVTGSRTSYSTTALTSTATGAVLSGLPFDSTSAPTISGLTDSGAAIVGRTLTASVSDWEPTATTISYQWLSNGSAIRGATTTSYLLKAADVGKAISVRVTGSRSGYSTTALTSTATGAVLSGLPFDTTSAPTISGTPVVGQTLSASVSGWDPTPTRLTYQWLANGSPINRATGATYRLVAANVGRTITVRVTGTAPGRASVTLTSSPTSTVTR
jgi:subtilisin family serine protease